MKKASVGVVAKCAAEVIDRETGEAMAADGALVRLAMQGFELVKQIDALEVRLKTIKDDLAEKLGAGRSLIVPGVCRVSVEAREAVSISDPDRLRLVLGDRFDNLVRAVMTYKPEPRLIEMACDGDEPLQPSIGACLKIGKSTFVKIVAAK